MVHPALCFVIWIVVFTGLFWRLITIVQIAVQHLQRLHQIPCDKCTYFTGDYRLKCTVNPIVAMSETAIGCRDFLYDPRSVSCGGCAATNRCSNSNKQQQQKHALPKIFKRKLTYLK